uniref:Uncharacterized protein n=1 Tax=Salix viminalis TaxID=40686 RepID=A0A6N2NA85_SALVM
MVSNDRPPHKKRDVDAYTKPHQPQIKGISFREPAVAGKHSNGDQNPSIPSFKTTSVNHPRPPKPFNTSTATKQQPEYRISFSSFAGNHLRDLMPTNSTSSDETPPPPPAAQPPAITPPDSVEIKFKRGSRRRNRKQRGDGGVGVSQPVKAAPKKWEDMSLSEKAIELYVGEKGALFWLNKFAYASIYIVIGGWILFRFVGPSLNLYQLDTAPLSPSSILKGS